MSQIILYTNDLPDDIDLKGSVAIDTETMGLNLKRDRLCLVQIGDEKGNVFLVKIDLSKDCPNLKRILTDKNILKIFHFARFDVAKIYQDLGVLTAPVYCTKIASKLVRTNTSQHGLKALCRDLIGVELNKEKQTSDWGTDMLTEEQKVYAASDVLYLHQLKEKLDALLIREGRKDIAEQCFAFLGTRALLDLLDFQAPDIFEH